MKAFEHFIITRFNVKLNNSDPDKRLDYDWLEYRFKLFDQFCYPSIRGQSNQNFKWIVYFDSQTPEIFQERIKQYSEDWKNFIPIYIENGLSRELNRQKVIDNLTEGVKYIITTRIDNDDAICKKFIENIQKEFNNQDFEFISFPYGHVFHTDGKLYSFTYLDNPFVSLIEKIKYPSTDGIKTIFCGVHTELSKLGNMKQVKAKYSWLQVVHGENILNTIRGIRQPINNTIRSEFLIKYDLAPPENKLYYVLDFLSSIIKTYSRSLVKFIFPSSIQKSLNSFIKSKRLK